jgi:hypothetical protein
MPARLMRVSSLLAGSAVEDELLGGIEGKLGEWLRCETLRDAGVGCVRRC